MVTDLEKCPVRISKDEEVLEYLWLSARVHSFLRPIARGRGAGGGVGGVGAWKRYFHPDDSNAIISCSNSLLSKRDAFKMSAGELTRLSVQAIRSDVEIQ